MQFKIKIEDLSRYKSEKKIPYSIRYELLPDNTKGIGNVIIHESKFSNLTKAQRVADDLSRFLAECHLYLDLVYTKLKQLEIGVNLKAADYDYNYQQLELLRIQVLKNSHKVLFAYEHIAYLLGFLHALKGFCFTIDKGYYSLVNGVFEQLQSFESFFVNSYRSAKLLSEKNELKLFL